MPPKCPVNCLLVELDKAYQDTITFESGVTLFKSIEWNPEWNTTCTGKVLSVPDKVLRKHESGVLKTEYEGLTEDARVGDEVIFSYMVVEDKEQREGNTSIHRNQFFFEGKYYWKVDYMHVLGYVREGKLVPVSNHTFLKDIVQEEEKVGSLFIPEMSRKGKKENRGVVIGDQDLPEGTVVVYPDRYAQRYEVSVNGKIEQFICLPSQYLAGVEA